MNVVATIHLTLDGIMQAPGRQDEDGRGGFSHGGWARPYGDAVMGQAMAEGMSQGGALLLGRRTYEDFFSVWPQRKDNPFTDVLNNMQKFVASRTLMEPLPWMNSTLISGNAEDVVADMKGKPGKDLVILGSGQLIQSLMRRGLIDRYLLTIHPLLLGSGRRLFEDGGPFASLKLIDSKTTSTGVIIATYQPADFTRDQGSPS